MTKAQKVIEFNAGNIWSDEYLDKVIELNNTHTDTKVTSIFGSVAHMTPTARSFDRIPFIGQDSLEKYIDKVRSNNIHIRYTLNTSCIGSIQEFKSSWEKNLKNAVVRLHKMGVDQWTITSPLLMVLMAELFPSDMLEVSTIAEVSTPEDLSRWSTLGANAVCLSTSINRDIRQLHVIQERAEKLRMDISLLANEACLFRCPFRRECYNLSSHDSFRGSRYFDNYPFKNCNIIRIDNPVEWVKSRMIMPQWIEHYRHITNKFKIAFRTHPYEVAIPILSAYMDLYHGGNYVDMWPTVSNLGNTAEPADTLHISCEELDRTGFINSAIIQGHKCNTIECGKDCSVCYRAFESAVRVPEVNHNNK
jgi:hypothetical protein